MASDRHVMVLACNSFSGAHFVDLLLEQGYSVTGISRSAYPDLMLPYRRFPGGDFRFHELNINTDLDRVLAILDAARPPYVVNFAAQGEVGVSFKHPLSYWQTNALGMVALTNALQQRDFIRKYVHISTPEVYGSMSEPMRESTNYAPSSPYAASKAASDLNNTVLFKTFGFPVVTIRATNVYGPHQQLYRIIPRTAIYIKLGKKLELHGGGVARKSFIHIRDVSEGEFAAMLHGKPGEVYHLSPDEPPISIRELVERVVALMGAKFEDAVQVAPERTGQDAAYIVDSAKARAAFGWRPKIGIEEGLAQCVAWVNANWDAIRTQPLEYQYRP